MYNGKLKLINSGIAVFNQAQYKKFVNSPYLKKQHDSSIYKSKIAAGNNKTNLVKKEELKNFRF